LVVKFTDVEKGGVLHDGFDILVEGDVRDFDEDKYGARVLNDNQVLLTIPAAKYSYIHDFETFFSSLQPSEVCTCTVVAHQVAHNAILGDKTRWCKHLLLQFPQGLVSSNQHYSPEDANHEGELKTDFVRYAKGMELYGKNLKSIVTTIFWKVTIMEETQRIVKRTVGTKKRNEATLAGRLGSMTI
jgi:hypothetical protein